MALEGFRNYEHDSGRKTRVRIEKEEKKGGGANAEVHEVKATVGFGKENKKELDTLVVKEYKEMKGDVSTADMVDISLRNHELLKNLGFPVPPTYRLDRKSNRILMTNVNVMHPESISVTTSRTADSKDLTIQEITNFDALVRDMLRNAEIASANHIDLGLDSYNVTVPRSGKGEARLFYTDLENIEVIQDESNLSRKRLLQDNINNAQRYLYDFFVTGHVPEEHRAKFLAVMASLFAQRKSELGLQETDLDKLIKEH